MSESNSSLNIQIEPVSYQDLAAIQQIYAHHVLHGLGTFEEVPPDLAEIKARYEKLVSNSYPYLVAKIDGQTVAYAYAGCFRERVAYRFLVEDSIYVHPDYCGHGLGAALLTELISACKKLGFCELVAVIGDSNNLGSINVHRKFGFEQVGLMKNVGYKFEQWVDVVIMQLSLRSF